MSIYTPYTYLIGWTKYDKWYYGVRYAKNCHPSDLWVKYFTSSKHVKEFREINGEPDVIQIRKKFNNHKDALIWEECVLRRLKVSKSDKWLNITHNRGFPLLSELPEDVQRRRSELISKSSKSRSYPGRVISEKSKEKSRKTHKKIWKSYTKEEYEKRCEKFRNGQSKISENTRKKQIEKRKQTIDSKPDIICPHCGKKAKARSASAMSRHHFDNCKEISIEIIEKRNLIDQLKTDISKVKYTKEAPEITTGCYIQTRKLKSKRKEVMEIKIYLAKYRITLGRSWYQKNTKWLKEILHILRTFDDMIRNHERAHKYFQ